MAVGVLSISDPVRAKQWIPIHFISLLKIDIALKSGTMISNAFDVEIGIIISLNPVETIRAGKRSSKERGWKHEVSRSLGMILKKEGLFCSMKTRPSPSIHTFNRPAAVSIVYYDFFSLPSSRRTIKEAIVAWPQRGTSPLGVNYSNLKSALPESDRNTVSE